MRKNGPMAAHTLILNILPHLGFLRKQILARERIFDLEDPGLVAAAGFAGQAP